MKKIISIVLALALVLGICACGKKEEEVVGANVVSPLTSYDSLEALNEAAGSNLCHPGVMGVTDNAYQMIDAGDRQIAEYKFTVAGYDCTFRFCALPDKDISGIWMGDEGTAFKDEMPSELEYAYSDEYMLARWLNVDGLYTFALTGESLPEKETFEGIVEELQICVLRTMGPEEQAAMYGVLAGDYFDSVSMRAVATVEDKGDCVGITIMYSNSATELVKWTMNASFGEEGLLNYNDMEKVLVTADENGNETTEVLESGVSGSFCVTENLGLSWAGASEEEYRELLFEKPELD